MNKLRLSICEKLSQVIRRNNVYYELEVPSRRSQSAPTRPTYQLPLPDDMREQEQLVQALPQLAFNHDVVESVRLQPAEGKNTPKIEFQVQPQAFAESLLLPPTSETIQSPSLQSHLVFEFSSPNIAKPFHVGHIRSTIIGNVLANLHEHLGHKVTRLNYLGDWGTQLGMLQVGVEFQGVTDEQMRQQPIETLYNAYVVANLAAKSDASISEKARRYFTQLETGENTQMAKQWQKYRTWTIAELDRIYGRLGVRFDHYEWESQYSQQQIVDVLANLEQNSLLHAEHDGRKIVQVGDRRVPVIKSDGSTLYLVRDIAAILDRLQRFQFERIYYIVENAQTDHFNALFTTTAALTDALPLGRMQHVKFGRIHGMSTRSGNVVFLRDVLDEARDIMLEKQLKSPTTKVHLESSASDFKTVADILGVSAVIVNDLKQRRQRDYDFDWQKVLQVNGDTGIKLQYTHCRLYSLLHTMNALKLDVRPQIEHLNEPEAQELLMEIARFEQAVWSSAQQLEACVLVNYLFSLCNSTSRALKRLNVKNETCAEKQQNRLLLFGAAKRKLNAGMLILGLRPLNEM